LTKREALEQVLGPIPFHLSEHKKFLFGNTFAATSLKFSAQTNPPPQKQKTNKQTNKKPLKKSFPKNKKHQIFLKMPLKKRSPSSFYYESKTIHTPKLSIFFIQR